jgi:hypothetical protein
MTTPIEALRKVISADDCMKDGMQGAGRILNNAIDNARAALAAHDARQQEPDNRHLLNLLAIIHRDGGHHTAEVGLEQSVKDAHERWGMLIQSSEAQKDPIAWKVDDRIFERLDYATSSAAVLECALVPLYDHPSQDQADAARYRRIAWLIGSIYVHGGFKAETYNERELEGLLREIGCFWDSIPDFDAAMKEQNT